MIRRKQFEYKMSRVLRNWRERTSEWRKQGTVIFLHGRRGAGKTTALLRIAEKENAIYLSFRNLGSRQALNLFAQQLGHDESVNPVFSWNDAFSLLSECAAKQSKVLLDDFDVAAQNKEFLAAFESYRMKEECPKIFFLLAVTDRACMDRMNPQGLEYQLELYHYSVVEVKQSLPERTLPEVLEVYAITGGVPELVPLFAGEQSVWECLVNACTPNSLLLEWFPRYMSETFRSPQVYYEILYAIACGNKRISEIGTATGYPYNKCNSYVKNLIEANVLETYTMTNEAGVEKTGYRFACSYYKLWMKMVYMNQTAFTAGRAAEMVEKYRTEISDLVQEEYRAACYRTVNQLMGYDSSDSNEIGDRPLDVPMKNKVFHFDYFKKDKNGNGLYVKIYDINAPEYGLADENKICEAAAKIVPVYDGMVFVFCVTPYQKKALQRCEDIDTIHLCAVEHLQYPAGYEGKVHRRRDLARI